MQNPLIENLEKAQQKKRPRFSVGDKVSVSVRLKEGDKERLQAFKGVVIAKHPKSGRGPRATFTVRKISEGIGVERVFPIHSPYIEKIDVQGSSSVRRSRLYFLRNLQGKKARLKESERFAELIVPEETVASAAETAAPIEQVAPETKPVVTKPDTEKK